MHERISAKDVALLAGVSRAAVSRTFSKGQVSAKVRQKVLAAADELGYRPNAIARSLIGGRSNLIALITAGRDSIHNSMLIERLLIEITRTGKRALVVPAAGESNIDESILDASDYQVDSIVVIGGTVSPDIVNRLRRFGVPIFLYERNVSDPGLECITGNNIYGGRLAATYLVRTGRKRIAYVTKSLATFSNAARRKGLLDGLAHAGLELFAESYGDQSFDGGFRAGMELFAARVLPDAIFCFNDEMALGVLQAASTMNLSVPGDVAVMGYDDIPMAGWPAFDLTTIRNAIDAPIGILLRRIAARIDGDAARREPHVIEPELVVRRTA